MKELEKLLLEHSQKYPRMETVDYIKLIYQNEFAGGHMIVDPYDMTKKLEYEYETLEIRNKSEDIALYESVGNGLCRVNLCASEISRCLLPLINRLFVVTSNQSHGTMASFLKKLNYLETICAQGKLPLNLTVLHSQLEKYRKDGCPMVSHSQIYRQNYAPHYRIIAEKYMKYFWVFAAVQKLQEKEPSVVLAIEGRCGSGKTMLAAMLDEVFDCNSFHMDDFFLPFEMKTAERLSQAGGNVHYERFLSEVLEPMKIGKTIVYRPYLCAKGELGEQICVEPKKLTIVEGSYCFHPELRSFYDCSVFLSVNPQVQQLRILNRSGRKMLESFIEHWIPMEEYYFEELSIASKCDFTIDTSEL